MDHSECEMYLQMSLYRNKEVWIHIPILKIRLIRYEYISPYWRSCWSGMNTHPHTEDQADQVWIHIPILKIRPLARIVFPNTCSMGMCIHTWSAWSSVWGYVFIPDQPDLQYGNVYSYLISLIFSMGICIHTW
jgi:hypothetical protein